jgi:hypothetical protein
VKFRIRDRAYLHCLLWCLFIFVFAVVIGSIALVIYENWKRATTIDLRTALLAFAIFSSILVTLLNLDAKVDDLKTRLAKMEKSSYFNF